MFCSCQENLMSFQKEDSESDKFDILADNLLAMFPV